MNFIKAIKSNPSVAKALKHPFKSHFKAESVGFGFTFATNFGTGLVNRNPPISPYEFPQSFTWIVLAKSAQHAIICHPFLSPS